MENKSDEEAREVWVFQTLLLTMIYAAYSGDIKIFERGMSLQSVLANVNSRSVTDGSSYDQKQKSSNHSRKVSKQTPFPGNNGSKSKASNGTSPQLQLPTSTFLVDVIEPISRYSASSLNYA